MPSAESSRNGSVRSVLVACTFCTWNFRISLQRPKMYYSSMYFLVCFKIFEDFKQHDCLSWEPFVSLPLSALRVSRSLSLFLTCPNICPSHFRKCSKMPERKQRSASLCLHFLLLTFRAFSFFNVQICISFKCRNVRELQAK